MARRDLWRVLGADSRRSTQRVPCWFPAGVREIPRGGRGLPLEVHPQRLRLQRFTEYANFLSHWLAQLEDQRVQWARQRAQLSWHYGLDRFWSCFSPLLSAPGRRARHQRWTRVSHRSRPSVSTNHARAIPAVETRPVGGFQLALRQRSRGWGCSLCGGHHDAGGSHRTLGRPADTGRALLRQRYPNAECSAGYMRPFSIRVDTAEDTGTRYRE